MSNHDKGEIKNVFKLDSAENIGKKLLHGRDPSTYQGGSGGLGLVGGVAKGVVKAAGAFANTAKQYLNLARGSRAAKKTSNFRPLITGNKIYGRKEINDAFASRFGKPQNVIQTATENKDALTHLKRVKKMESNVGSKNNEQALTSSTKRTNFTSGR